MPRLAIVISAVGSVESLEATLVSVLENRPTDSEIVVALDRPYSDPYELADEVRFVRAASRSNRVASINQAIAATRAPFVHLLSAGCTVSENWVEPAMARFGDRRVAAVAPLAMDAEHPTRILAAGLGYRRGGRRFLIGKGETSLQPAARSSMIGACGFAAFYRTAALALVGGLSPQLGLAQADVDLTLAIAEAGLSVVLEPQSRVFAGLQVDAPEGSFYQALHEERLFWRNVPNGRLKGALAAHLGLVAIEVARGCWRPSTLLALAGRTLACCQVGSYVRHRAALKQLSGYTPSARHADELTRVDRSHQVPSHSRAEHTEARVH